MQRDKITSLIGFAVKSSKILYGLDNIRTARQHKHLIIYDSSISTSTLSNLKFFADKYGIPIIKSVMPLEDIVYKTNCKVLALTDRQMSEAIIANIDSSKLYMAEVILIDSQQ